MIFERSNSREEPLPEQRLFVITFAAGIVLAVLAIGALLELRSRMLAAFSALGTINVLQANRATSVSYLIDARDRAADDAYSAGGALPRGNLREGGRIDEELSALEAVSDNDRKFKAFVDTYVDAANSALVALKNVPAEPAATGYANLTVASRYVARARRASEELDSILRQRADEGRESLRENISRIVLAVGGLVAAVALVSLTQGWELLAMGRRLFTAQSDSAEKIAKLSSTLSESREALDVVNLRLTLAMRSAHVVVFSIEPSGEITWSNDAGSGVFGGLTTPFLLSDLAPEADRVRILQRVIGASRSENVIEFEMRVERLDLDRRWLKITLLPLDVEDRGGLLGSAVDVTDIKRREEGTILLMRELSHRSKNLLAIVQAMARQTARTAGSPVEFYERFGSRLRALAAGHDLLVKSVYTSADFGELIRTQIGALAGLIGSRVFAEGPMVRLRPEATQNLGMALHELATNAQIHGAMSTLQGRIDIGWSLEGGGADGRLVVDWVESNGPNIGPSDRRGFGSTLILENLPRSLHGAVTLDHAPGGTCCHMELPFKYTLESWDADVNESVEAEPSHA